MLNRHEMARASWGKYLVLAVVVADCIGIYFANARLNQPPAEPSLEPSGEAVALPDRSPATHADVVVPQPQFAAGDTLPKSVGKPVTQAELPAFMPLPPVAKEETATFVPTVEVATLRPDFARPRMARLQPSRMASHRFVSAFATDIVNPAVLEPASPGAGLGIAAPSTDQAQQPGAMDAGVETEPARANDNGLAELPAPAFSATQAPVSPEPGAAPMSELPAAEGDPGAESPAG